MLEEVHPRMLIDQGIPGWMTLFWATTAIVTSLLCLWAAWKETNDPQWRVRRLYLSVGAVQALGISFVAAHAVVRDTRRAMTSTKVFKYADEVLAAAPCYSESAYLVVGAALFLTVLFVGFASVRGAWRTSRSASSWFVPLAGMLLLLVTATGILIRAYQAMYPYRGAQLAVYELLWLEEQTGWIFPPVRFVIRNLAAFASVLVVVWCAVRQGEPSRANERQAFVISLGVAILGFGFWGLTRRVAHDGANPLPFPDGFAGYDCPTQVVSSPSEWPKIDAPHDQCAWDHLRRYEPSVTLDLGTGGPSIGGQPIKDPADARDYVQKHVSNGRDPSRVLFPDLLVAAPASKPPHEWGSWLAAVGKPWRGRPAAIPSSSLRVVMVHDQSVIHSATVGDIRRNPRCSCPPIGLSQSGASDISGYDWGRFAETAASASIERPLVVNPGWNEDDDQDMQSCLRVEK